MGRIGAQNPPKLEVREFGAENANHSIQSEKEIITGLKPTQTLR